MPDNAGLIQKFYTSFQARDAAGMNACYHPAIVFADPVFGRLEGDQADGDVVDVVRASEGFDRHL